MACKVVEFFFKHLWNEHEMLLQPFAQAGSGCWRKSLFFFFQFEDFSENSSHSIPEPYVTFKLYIEIFWIQLLLMAVLECKWVPFIWIEIKRTLAPLHREYEYNSTVTHSVIQILKTFWDGSITHEPRSRLYLTCDLFDVFP